MENPTQKLDLIVPRGGEKLISFVKKNTKCHMIVSGRGNNFVYVENEADLDFALNIIINGKDKILACNAVDKVLVSASLPNRKKFIESLIVKLVAKKIEILGDAELSKSENI